MPPVVPRKRFRSDSPKAEPPPKRTAHSHPRRKEAATNKPPTTQRTNSQKQAALSEIFGNDEDSELSEPTSSEDDFEDVPIARSDTKGKGKANGNANNDSDGSDGSDESEDEEWEDALGAKHHTKLEDEPAPVISGDLELTLDAPTQIVYSRADGKKGPSKIERQIRNVTHCMHVQFLMFHNLIRNGWILNQEVQKIMVNHLNLGCWKAIDRYWRDSGISNGQDRIVKGGWSEKIEQELKKTGTWAESGKKGVQIYQTSRKNVKGKGASSKAPAKASTKASSSKREAKDAKGSDRNQRDWGATSERLEPNTPNLSAGDPLLRLVNYLAIYWRGKFKITAPSLHKRGYLSPSTLEAEVQAWKEHALDTNAFGERIETLDGFRALARRCEGSRDVGEQLFASLLRGLGIEARMVASLQPVGFRWSKSEEGVSKDLENLQSHTEMTSANEIKLTQRNSTRSLANGDKDDPIDLSDSELSSAISLSSGSDDEVQESESKSTREDRRNDRTMPYPTYWTEAISHLTHCAVSISVLPRVKIASPTSGDYSNFVSTTANADKGVQVFAYAVAHSSDGSAKDVTNRYLRGRWPGVTKGYRMPVEKIPIHNKLGKVKRWEEWNWFKSVMRPFARAQEKRQPYDEVEDEGDLVPLQPLKPKNMDEEGGKETLQGYKTSTQYILERHLRREEALKPNAKIVRHFVTGKGDNLKQEPVYLRKDVLIAKTVETWHKEGRAVKEGEQPIKMVPIRAVTVQRKREIEERERDEGTKVKQGLYSKAQTDWIIPDPIIDGKIPRNAFGNIDVYVPTMVPKGAIHIPLKGTGRICRKLNIDYAEACTGFEFGRQRAVPVITGVVVAAENEDLVIDAWEADQEQKLQKEQDKREKLVLGLWKKFMSGLRIVERLKRDYGEDAEIPEEGIKKAAAAKRQSEWDTYKNHSDFEGGFLRDGQTDASEHVRMTDGASEKTLDLAGGFVVDDDEGAELSGLESTTPNAVQTPMSLHSMHHQNPVKAVDDEEILENSDDKQQSKTQESAASKSQARKNNASARARGRGRGNKRTPGSTSKRITDAPDEVLDDQEASQPARQGKRKTNMSSPIASRPTSTRKAARKSDAQIKSHFFAGSDDETDATDATGASPQKTNTKGRGGRGRGRGRGNSRWKAA